MWPDTGRGPIRGGQEGTVFRERKSNCWGHLGTIQKHCGFRNPRAGAHALHQLTCTLLGRVPSKGCAELPPTPTPAVSHPPPPRCGHEPLQAAGGLPGDRWGDVSLQAHAFFSPLFPHPLGPAHYHPEGFPRG